jgi:hypothetical protein
MNLQKASAYIQGIKALSDDTVNTWCNLDTLLNNNVTITNITNIHDCIQCKIHTKQDIITIRIFGDYIRIIEE